MSLSRSSFGLADFKEHCRLVDFIVILILLCADADAFNASHSGSRFLPVRRVLDYNPLSESLATEFSN